jgi:uncharacterized protein (TIGR01777 family)
MKTLEFLRRTRLPAPAGEVYRWHERPGAFERLVPPWERVAVCERTGGIREGTRVTLRGPGGRWVVEHRDVVPGSQFRDVLLSGPFPRWVHTHRMTPDGADGSVLEDRIEYALPLGGLGSAVAGPWVRRSLERLFEYRHRRTSRDLLLHRGSAPMNILVTGSTGLVGRALVPFLSTGGHEVRRLDRKDWDPEGGCLDPGSLENLDAVVHLAGENIAASRWTASRKARIRTSRIQGTRLLCERLAKLDRPPRVLVSASAVGYYGDRGGTEVDESAGPGFGFLAEVCQDWERATGPAVRAGMRVVNLRIGMVLAPLGGALGKMLVPFRAGLGGRLGHGRQFVSWISISDLTAAILRCLSDDSLRGPVNAVAPGAVTNREFTRTLGSVLWRPALLPMPAFAARLAFGEMADELLLSGTKVRPARLEAAGFMFEHPTLETALVDLLGRHKENPR